MEDAKIVQLYLERNEQAIPATADKYGHYCMAIAQKILENSEDAEECVNDTYWKTWNAIPPHRPQILSAFLGKIVRNLAFNRYKREHAEKRGSGAVTAVLDELEDCVAGNEHVAQEMEYKELVATICDFLRTLPAEKRNIFVCRYWYADSVSEIAVRYGMTSAAVAMLLSRLRIKLHNFLEKREYGR